MNNTIGLSQLITRLAKLTDTDTGTARRFLRTLFATIEEALVQGEEVNIKGIGTFRRSDDTTFGSPTGVIFIPDEKLASEVNAPFAIFEPVELADDVDFTEEAAEEPAPVPEPVPEPEPVEKPEPEPESVPEPEPEPEPIEEEPQPSKPILWPEEEEEIEAPEEVVADEPEETEEEPEEDESEKSNRTLWIGAALAIVAACVLGYICAVYVPDDSIPEYAEEEELTETPALQIEEVGVEDMHADSESEVAEPQPPLAAETEANTPEFAPKPTVAADAAAQRRDTVTKTRFLATMAREYYGKGIYWVYIYEANKDVISNPNRIQPGTEVVIPDKSSFAASTEKETQQKAERLQAELFKKYK